jgi:hypothetical protein
MFSKAMITAHSSEESVMKRLEKYSGDKSEAGCIEWTGGKDRGGYGKMAIGLKRLSAHRVAYAMLVGPIPEGKVLMHSCDNPACINPDHLSIGTQKENIQDSIGKGRFTLIGENSLRPRRRVVGAVRGDELMIFKDIYEAERKGFLNSKISESCTKGRLYKGFQWSYLT